MTKRQLKNEFDDVSDEVLGELSPDERMQLVLEAQATGKESWVDRLVETCATHQYYATDLAYVERCRLAVLFLQHAVYDLHTTLLLHEYLDLQQKAIWVRDGLRDEPPSEDELERASERAEKIHWSFADLYTLYHGYRQFATEELGLEIDTWFALHSNGAIVLDAVRELLDEDLRRDFAVEGLNRDLQGDDVEAGDPEWITLQELATQRYEAHAEIWADAIAEVPTSS